MKKKISNKVLWGLGGIILILIFTNPSNESYTEFLKINGFQIENHYSDIEESIEWGGSLRPRGWNPTTYEPLWGKKFNYFIFSSFKYNDGEHHLIRNHIGILSNFFEIKPSIKK